MLSIEKLYHWKWSYRKYIVMYRQRATHSRKFKKTKKMRFSCLVREFQLTLNLKIAIRDTCWSTCLHVKSMNIRNFNCVSKNAMPASARIIPFAVCQWICIFTFKRVQCDWFDFNVSMVSCLSASPLIWICTRIRIFRSGQKTCGWNVKMLYWYVSTSILMSVDISL